MLHKRTVHQESKPDIGQGVKINLHDLSYDELVYLVQEAYSGRR